MNIDFSLVLIIVALTMGIVIIIDRLFLKNHTKLKDANNGETTIPWYLDWSESLLPVLILVLIIRSFIFEPFRIPSGSLEPTLQIGDLIVVNKFDYGLRLPVAHTKIFSNHTPRRGDIVVFRWPLDPTVDYIKRIVGLPGDHIEYHDKKLFVNGIEAKQTPVGMLTLTDEQGNLRKAEEREEDLGGIKHRILLLSDQPAKSYEYTVPEGQYFAMGDNRDDSSDSRYWGYVPESNLLGKAMYVWMSWDNQTSSVRFNRIGTAII